MALPLRLRGEQEVVKAVVATVMTASNRVSPVSFMGFENEEILKINYIKYNVLL
jgi:hypothetical protein